MAVQKISVNYFLDLFDEFKGVPQPKIEMYIKLASSRVAQNVWCDLWEAGVSYLAAHMLATGGGAGGSGGGAGGPITAEAVGDLSRSYGTVGVAGSGDELFMTTRYGQMFIELRNEVVLGYQPVGRTITLPGTVV